MARIGVYPGTFDPITLGHRDIIKRALKVVDKLVIAIAEDIPKQPIFPIDVRTSMVTEEVLKYLPQECVDAIEVKPFRGLLVDFVKEQNAGLIIRGLRAVSDFDYEFQMSCMNLKIAPEIETIFLPATESTHFIASRFVKEIARLRGDISHLVSPHVDKKVTNYYSQQRSS